jgi:hypothetical protein
MLNILKVKCIQEIGMYTLLMDLKDLEAVNAEKNRTGQEFRTMEDLNGIIMFQEHIE